MKKLLTLLLFFSVACYGQDTTAIRSEPAEHKPVAKKWYENISIRGYMQVRYNRLLETNPQLKCDQCDRSIGEGGGIFLRRMRVIFLDRFMKEFTSIFNRILPVRPHPPLYILVS